jgi:SAM-dependent methyltransferase
MSITNPLKSLMTIYKNFSNIGKILFFISLFLVLIILFKTTKHANPFVEGFDSNSNYIYKSDEDVYDKFYSDIYDHLVYNNYKDDYEVTQIMNSTKPTDESIILDVGSGTGHHVSELASKGLNIIGLDISPSMVAKAKFNFPTSEFKLGNALNPQEFQYGTFTHIMCLYFTIYFFKDKRMFFNNCMDWLKPGGTLIVHLVDRENFDPILPPGNPLYIVSPQKYAKKRITKTKITFNEVN